MIIYTDGSANPNPGPGAFGVLALDNTENFVYNIHRESSENTTNNREELKAIIYSIKTFGIDVDDFSDRPIVYSDSVYAVNAFNNWIFGWMNNNWETSSGKQAENLDLLLEYYECYRQGQRIDLRKIYGHSGIKGNEIVDKIASGKYKNYNKEYIDLWWKI